MSNPIESPCNTCDHRQRDKNHPDCVNCDLRIKYAVKRGILHPEVLEQKEDPVVFEAREVAKKIKRCKGCRQSKPIKARGRCTTCYARWKYSNADKVRPYKKRGTLIE